MPIAMPSVLVTLGRGCSSGAFGGARNSNDQGVGAVRWKSRPNSWLLLNLRNNKTPQDNECYLPAPTWGVGVLSSPAGLARGSRGGLRALRDQWRRGWGSSVLVQLSHGSGVGVHGRGGGLAIAAAVAGAEREVGGDGGGTSRRRHGSSPATTSTRRKVWRRTLAQGNIGAILSRSNLAGECLTA